MFAHKKITSARGTLTTLYQTLYIWIFGCLLASYGSTMHPARLLNIFWWFSDHLFFLVCGPLVTHKVEKKKISIIGTLGSGWDRKFYMGMQNGSNYEL